MQVQSSGREDALEEAWQPTPNIFYLENPHGQRRLAGYRPRGCKER